MKFFRNSVLAVLSISSLLGLSACGSKQSSSTQIPASNSSGQQQTQTINSNQTTKRKSSNSNQVSNSNKEKSATENTQSENSTSNSVPSGFKTFAYTHNQKDQILKLAQQVGMKKPYIPKLIEKSDELKSVEPSGKFIFLTLRFENMIISESSKGSFAVNNVIEQKKVNLKNGIPAKWIKYSSSNGDISSLIFKIGETYFSISNGQSDFNTQLQLIAGYLQPLQ